MTKKKLTTALGHPIADKQNSLTAGKRGPTLIQDFVLVETMAHFNRERIPERVVHAKGSGAYGTFTVTNDITKYTKAKIFSEVGKQTRCFARFSTVGGEKGSADTERDPRGFALKFYTEDGIWDLVGNNTPVFFIRDGIKFQDFIHTQKRDPRTNCKSPTMMWDYWSLNPESLHQVTILMSDRGTPKGYRFMNGYSSHTYSMINKDNERVWVKFHFKTAQGINNFNGPEAEAERGVDPDYSQRDLVEAIDRKDFPKWNLKIQVMTEEQAKNFRFNPFDITKVWPHGEFPLIDAGVMELNEIPDNYFAHVEQAAFEPTNIVQGIGFSPDRMLQARILSYPDAHRYRLGSNYQQLPVNRCPLGYSNYQRDGAMRYDDNGGSGPNYYPNSFDGPEADPSYKEIPLALSGEDADRYDRNEGNDDFTQPGDLYRKVMNDEERQRLINNIVGHMSQIAGPKKDEIINRQICHFFRADPEYGQRVADGLGVDINKIIESAQFQHA